MLLDDTPVFNEEFKTPALIISQTTTWDPLQVPSGRHKLIAKVYGANGKTYISATFNLDVRGHGFTIFIGEVLVDGEMIVEPSDMSVLTRHLSLTHWLLNQSLHASRFAVVAISESRELRNR